MSKIPLEIVIKPYYHSSRISRFWATLMRLTSDKKLSQSRNCIIILYRSSEKVSMKRILLKHGKFLAFSSKDSCKFCWKICARRAFKMVLSVSYRTWYLPQDALVQSKWQCKYWRIVATISFSLTLVSLYTRPYLVPIESKLDSIDFWWVIFHII